MDLPQVLRTAPAPRLVDITCLQIGTSRAQLLLDTALASVRWLRLETFEGGLHVCVPEVTAWESLMLHTKGSLDIQFDAGAHPSQNATFPALEFKCAALTGCGVLGVI